MDNTDRPKVIVRRHPAVRRGNKQVDLSPEDVARLIALSDKVSVVLINPDGTKRLLEVSHADFQQIVPDEVVITADEASRRR